MNTTDMTKMNPCTSTEERPLTHLGKSHRTSAGKKFLAFAALTLVAAFGLATRAYADEPPTLTVTPTYNDEIVTITNVGSGNTLYYILAPASQASAPTFRAPAPEEGEDPWTGAEDVEPWSILVPDTVNDVLSYVLSVKSITTEQKIFFHAGDAAAQGSPSSGLDANILVQRYAEPTIAKVASQFKFTVALATTDGGSNIKYAVGNGAYEDLELDATDHNHLFDNGADGTDNAFEYYTTYYFRAYNASTPARFPSKAATINTSRYNLPAIADFTPLHLSAGSMSTPSTGHAVSNSPYIYLNYNRYNTPDDPSSGLKTPTPSDGATYNDTLKINTTKRHTARSVNVTINDFLLLAAAPTENDNDEATLFPSTAVAADTFYSHRVAFHYKDGGGTPHYLGLGPDGNTKDFTVFSDSCLWERDAYENTLYQTRNEVPYYLHMANDRRMTASTHDKTSFALSGSGLVVMDAANRTKTLYYSASAPHWRWDNNPASGTAVHYTVKHEYAPSVTRRIVEHIAVENLEVTGDIHTTPSTYRPNWLALEQGASWHLKATPHVSIGIHSLPPYEHYRFECTESQTHEFVYYNGYSYASDDLLPNRHTVTNIINPENEGLTFTWNIVPVTTGDSTIFTVTESEANGHQADIARAANSEVDRPTEFALTVTMRYQEAANDIDATATSRVVTLIAEQEVDNLIPIPNTRTNVVSSTFHSGHHYLVRNEHIVGPDPAYLSAEMVSRHAARTTTKATAERVFIVRSQTVHTTAGDSVFYSFEDPALDNEDQHHEHLFLTWTGHDMYCMYHPNADFREGDAPNESTPSYRQQFYLQPFANGEGNTYFTLRPRGTEDKHRSLMPALALTTQDTVLRIAPSARSHFRYTSNSAHTDLQWAESEKEYFYASRWELEDPRLLPPTVTMDPAGVVTIDDEVGELRGVLGTLKWEVQRNGHDDWPDSLKGSYAIPDQDHHTYTIPGLLLADGDSILAWKEAPTGVGEPSWFDDSPKTRFGAKKSTKPDINVLGHDNTVTFTATADDTIYYASGTLSSGTHWDSHLGPSASESYNQNVQVYAYTHAPNKLGSDTAHAPFVPQLAVVIHDTNVADKVFLKAVVKYSDGSTFRVDTNSYIIWYTDNNEDPQGRGHNGQPTQPKRYNATDGIPYTGFVMIKAYAIAKTEGAYRKSEPFAHLFKGNYYTFCFLKNDRHGQEGYAQGEHDNNFLLIDLANHNSLINSTSLSTYNPDRDYYSSNPARLRAWTGKTYLWMGATPASGQVEVQTPIRNVETGDYLNYDLVQGLHAGDDGEQLWTWTGEADTTTETGYNNRYRLRTQVEGNWYYLAFDTEQDQWKAVSDTDSTCAKQVAFRTFTFDYQGGKEFQPLSDSLYIMPEDATEWQTVAGDGERAWAALSSGQKVQFRVGLTGLAITYHENMDINIVRPEYSAGRRDGNGKVIENDPDFFVPWQQWHRYIRIVEGSDGKDSVTQDSAFTFHYSKVDGFDTVRTHAHVDNLTHIDWQYDGHSLTADGAWHDLGSNGLFKYFINSNEEDTILLRRTDTVTHAGEENEKEPDFSTLLQVHITYDNPYANGFNHNTTGNLHLFAEQANTRTPFNTDGERTRFVSCSYTGDTRQYLSIDTARTVRSEDSLHWYLNGQPVVETNSEYTQFAAWMVRTAGGGIYTIRPIHWLDRSLCHRPGNKYEHGDSVRNGLYLYDSLSAESINWTIFSKRPAGPFAQGDSIYKRFAIYTFGPDTKEYVVISPYRLGRHNGQNINLADHIGLSNHDGDHLWVNAFFGSEKVAGLTEDQIVEKCQKDFWSTRWEEEHAWLTPPDIYMDPSGYVTLKHRLEEAPYPTGQTWQNKLKYYWKIGSAPTFTGTVDDDGGLAPGTGFSAAEGTTLYDPMNPPETLPKLNEDETLYAVAVLTDNCTTEHFYYKKHISKPHTFTAKRCATPKEPEDMVNGYITCATEGDNIVAAVITGDLSEPHWDNLDPHCVHEADSVSLRSIGYRQGNNVQAIAYRYNKLESLPLDLFHGYHLSLEMTGVDTAISSAAVYFKAKDNSDSHIPLTKHYNVWYTTDGTDPITSGTRQQATLYAGKDTSHKTSLLTFDLNDDDKPLPITVKAVAMTNAGTQYYDTSEVLVRRVVPNKFPGSDLTRNNTRNGSKPNPFLIETPDDLLTVAKRINDDGNPIYSGTNVYYKVTANINMEGIDDFKGIGIDENDKRFQGHWDGNYKTISHLSSALFNAIKDAHVYNVVIDSSQIERDEINKALGGIVNDAYGYSVIYNCGVRSSDKDHPTTITNKNNRQAGAILGFMGGQTRVVNCYNFATIEMTQKNVGRNGSGLVAHFNTEWKSTKNKQMSVVFNCVNYGKVVTNGDLIYPVLNLAQNSNYLAHNFYNANAGYKLSDVQNDGSFGVDTSFLMRFEQVRHIMNSNRRRCGWWVNAPFNTNNAIDQDLTLTYFDTLISADTNVIGKWVLDTTIAKYPILVSGKSVDWKLYPSIINPDYQAAWRDNETRDYHGRKLTEWGDNGVLHVTVKDGTSQNRSKNLDLKITDMDTLRYDYNWGKVQLPYFTENALWGKGSHIRTDTIKKTGQPDEYVDYIVTGWKITSITKNGTAYDTMLLYSVENGVTALIGDSLTQLWQYNFANRKSLIKDLYFRLPKANRQDKQIPGRVFAQGGYYNVPEGVKAITIEAYWGKAIYLTENRNDVRYNGRSIIYDNKSFYGETFKTAYTHAKTADTSMSVAINHLTTGYGDTLTVYDQAIVLLSDFHLSTTTTSTSLLTGNSNAPFTITTIDEDNDHEPDYVLYHYFNNRSAVNPIRFDFITYADYSMAGRTDASDAFHLGLTLPMGHYEITETATAHFYQFEYDRGGKQNTNKIKAPLILNGGLFETMLSAQNAAGSASLTNPPTDESSYIARTHYIHMGGHVYEKRFSQCANPNNSNPRPTKRCPVTVTGGEYKEFYLSGYLFSVRNPWQNGAQLYASGGHFKKYCSGGMEEIKGDIIVKADHILADEFYSGGMNPATNYKHKGSINVTIDNSWVKGTFTAGPKFGEMIDNTTVTARATNTRFGEYYGAGLGGTALVGKSEVDKAQVNDNMIDGFTGKGNWPDSISNNCYMKGKYRNNGIDIDYMFEFLPWSHSLYHCKRLYSYSASLSKATVNKTQSTLKGCTIDGNYYGGGYVGQVKDSAISVLENCTVKGNIFGGGNSSTIPYAVVYDWLGNDVTDEDTRNTYPQFVGGVYINVDKNHNDLTGKPSAGSEKYYWANTTDTRSKWDSLAPVSNNGDSYIRTNSAGIKVIYTSQSLNDLGQCEVTHLTVRNCTVGSMKGDEVDTTTGSIYGGGNEAEVKDLHDGEGTCTTYVAVQGTSHVLRDVFGAGKEGTVHGGTQVEIGKDKESGAEHRPWIEGDVYGGGDLADAKGDTRVTLYEGITGPVYGGGNQGSVLGNATVTVKGGFIGYEPTPTKDESGNITGYDRNTLTPIVNEVGRDKMYYGIFGGGYGYGTVVSGKATVQVGDAAMNADVKVYGSVYGGGEAGQVGGGYRTKKYDIDPDNPITITNNNKPYIYMYDAEHNTVKRVKANSTAQKDTAYYTFQPPTWPADANTYTTTVTIVPDASAENKKSIDIAGAVFGGGRGYYVTTVESNGTIRGTEHAVTQPHAGAVYGNTKVTVGDNSYGDTTRLHIGSFDYYMDQETGWKYTLLEPGMLTNQGVFWQQDLSVFDYDVQRYITLTMEGEVDYHKVLTTDNKLKTININATQYDPEVQYFLKMGRVTVAGGGERGAVYGSTCFATDSTLLSNTDHFGTGMTGGNSTVEIKSGTMGDFADGEVEGCVYGAGLSADIDGTSTVTVDGENVWVRGDVYAGGCMGHVYNYMRADSNATTTATRMDLKQGWVRNAFGGSNLADHGKGCNSALTVGTENSTDHYKLLVSESVYGGNGFSPSRGTATVTMYSGMIGYVHPDVTINTATNTTDDAIPSEGNTPVEGTTTNIYLNNQDNLAYEGNVYGGGFGPEAFVEGTTVTVSGGIIRNGVFGGGELAAVRKPKWIGSSQKQYTHRLVDDKKTDSTTTYGYTDGDTLTHVTVSGGEMAMVLGGGRGYTNFVRTKNRYTGTVMGNTRVAITGGTVRPSTGAIVRDLGGGNVYGGGLEGEVTGGTVVTVTGGTVEGSVFGGGRGYRYAMTGSNAVTTENITHRASRDAGAVYGDTRVTVTSGAVQSGVYGGGEGLNYASNVGGMTYYDTVATLHGNATVELKGGIIGMGHTYGGATGRGSYAGGRIASVRGVAKITVEGTADVAQVYGGNDICGKVMGGTGRTTANKETRVQVTGTPQIGRVFGGGNGKYDYYANFDMQKYLHLTMPAQQSTDVLINMGAAGRIGAAFGAGNEAPIDSAQVVLNGQGVVDSLFGGGNNATVNTIATVTANCSIRDGNTENVNHLFGGNNQATMYIVPDIALQSGIFGRVFGGGNAGGMEGMEIRKDIFNNDVKALSTYVLVDNENVTVTQGLYGGCNHATVVGGTYVDVRKTSTEGIAKLFGGNDISNYVHTARLDVSGGVVKKIFGGGNGYYDYTKFNGRYNAFVKGYGGVVDSNVAIFVDSVPITGSTLVNVWGGTIKSAIYGGGYAGHCLSTHVVINDKEGIAEEAEEPEDPEDPETEPAGDTEGPRHTTPERTTATIEGDIYGGGCGYEDLIYSGAHVDRHVGNVTEEAVTDLYHVTEMTGNKVYGGGMAGNVGNTLVTVHPSWEKPIDTLYGGCWGGDVKGTARVVMNCTAREDGTFTVTELYGGNDYSGTVHKSVLTINGGRYQNIYGAGNGDYGPAKNLKYLRNTTHKGKTLSADVPVPNSQFPVINFNDGIVMQNMYGGGNVGTCFVKDTLSSLGTAHSNLEDYALVQVNVHGGTFRNNIFAGASGEKAVKGSRPLIHGLKVLNMDDGLVYQSVYGGTKSLDDGYKNECVNKTTNTLRPSSVMNLVGGHVRNNVYGGGYLGNIYGSVYVNIGKEAVLASRIYERTYSSNLHTYNVEGLYKPVFIDDEAADTGSNLMARELKLDRSVYNGANWGDANNTYIFSTPGFFGGESRIRVDGQGYNTSSTDEGNSDPEMNINYSLIGAGTSCEGGDVYRKIEVLNYGDWEGCDVSKELWSVQRADKVIFNNVGLALTGDQDAYTAYASTPYTINRCDTILFRGENILRLEEPVVKAHVLEFRDTNDNLVDNIRSSNNTLRDSNLLSTMRSITSTDCTSDCAKVNAVKDHGYTSLLVNNGAYIDVFYPTNEAVENSGVTYGEVKGYAFLRAEDQTQAVVTARHKLRSDESNGPANVMDGGFFSMCYAENDASTSHGVNGGRRDSVGDIIYEYQYGNYTTHYRAWKMGEGTRLRHITITAHSDLTELPAQNRYVVAPLQNGQTCTLAVAKGVLELPPTKSGNYYKISGGINVDRENNEMQLIQGALLPGTYNTGTFETIDKWNSATMNTDSSYTLGLDGSENPQSQWISYNGSSPDWDEIKELRAKPNNHFGMLITGTAPLSEDVYGAAHGGDNTAAIYSNSYFTGTNGYCTKAVATGVADNVMPKLEVYLTYDPSFTATLMGDVEFTLYEYDPSVSTNEPVGSIDVIISVTTVVKALESQKITLVAMHNEFDNHEYVRKMVLPASLVRRNIYLTSIEWHPTPYDQDTCDNCRGNEHIQSGKDGNFFLKAYGNGTPAEDSVTFALKVSPTENLSSSLTTTLGWSEIDPNAKDLDLFTAAGKSGDPLAYSAKTGTTQHEGYQAVNLKSVQDPKGKFIGILDGRAAAGLEATLLFNGNKTYSDGIKGKAILHFDYYNQNTVGLDTIGNDSSGSFILTLYVETRKKGDTIYLASADTLKRYLFTGDSIVLKAWNSNNISAAYFGGRDKLKGREPIQYFQTFAQAMQIYKPGDVICILDTLIISGIENDVVHGSEYNFVPVVRYSGSHWQFPGDSCAYRGPMISLRQNGKLTAEYMRFDGSMVSKRKKVFTEKQTKKTGEDTYTPYDQETALGFRYHPEESATTGHYTYADTGWVKDTVAAIGPIFEVRDGAELTLSHNTKVQNNWNRSMNSDSLGGAIRIAARKNVNATDQSRDGWYKVSYQYTTRNDQGNEVTATYTSPDWIAPNPKVVLNNSVEIKNNFSNADLTGAVHLEDGVLQLGVANEGTAISIQNNYKVGSGNLWTDHSSDNRYTVNEAVVKNWKKANVYLAHAYGTPGDPSHPWPDTCMNDAKSRVVTFDNELSPDTRIGISKRFPGAKFTGHAAVRDTMQIAKVTGTHQQYIRTAYKNGNFFNDQRLYSYADVDTFYHEALSTHTLYLQRCATFQKQMFVADGEYDELPVLQYLMNTHAACPNGTDEAVFSVHGGCYPYTYTWTLGSGTNATEIRTYTTPYPHDKVKADIAAGGDRPKASASNSDTTQLAGMSFDNGTEFTYTAIATDLFGCQQRKSFKVTIAREDVPEQQDYDTLVLVNPANSNTNPYDWNDTSTHVETATRTFKEVHFIAKVQQETGWGQVLRNLGSTSGSAVADDTPLCPGDAVYLRASGKTNYRFIQWDFDPYDDSNTVFVMPNSGSSITVNAYFGPKKYWKDVVTGQSVNTNDIVIGYYGDVHVKTNKGLAWLISLCNGLNGVQARTFFNDTVYLADGTFDMSEYLWTPLGTDQHPFRGVLMPETGATPVISGIIVNEPSIPYVGFFAHLDSATVKDITIQKSHFVGQQYVGALAGEIRSASIISRVKVADAEGSDTLAHGYTTPATLTGANLTLITANYASGGIAGTMSGKSTITGCDARAKYMGATIYNGGVVGYGSNVNVSNTSVRALPRMSSLYSGGVVGNADGTVNPNQNSKSRGGSQIVNNYVLYYNPDGKASRAGGLVGRARNTYIANNYVYGENTGATLSGALGSVMENGVHVENCFFEQSFDNQAFGYNSSMDTTGVTSFHGTGRAVILTDTLDNNSSLTRQLNRWVYAHGDTTLHYWHSDTAGANNGYPLFGEPEYEPVAVTREVATCDSYRDYTFSGTYYYHSIDSAEFMDTTVTLLLTLNYSELTELSDTIRLGEGYEGHGFYLTPKEIEMMMQTLQEEGAVSVVVSDTLQTQTGCDSIVTLYLTVSSQLSTFNSQLSTLKVYPNPTTKLVTVEGTGLQEVELYDAVSRRLDVITSSRDNVITADLSAYPAGAYYLRIRTEHGTVIKKVIKR